MIFNKSMVSFQRNLVFTCLSQLLIVHQKQINNELANITNSEVFNSRFKRFNRKVKTYEYKR